MSADIIQFIPKANPNRLTQTEEVEQKAVEFLERAPALIASGYDSSPCEYVAPADGCA
jgi:hypothetical protein